MKVCRHLACDRPHHARGLCNFHYVRVRNGNVGTPSAMFGVFARARCEDCWDEPMGGGRWCLNCFQKHTAKPNRTTPGDSDPGRIAVKRGHVAIRDTRWAA